MRTKIKRTAGERIIFSIVFVLLAIYALFILYHFYFLLQLATKTDVEFDQALVIDAYGLTTNNATLNCMSGQIAQLFSLTKLVVPNGSVCPGWGTVTVTPAGASTTG